SPVPVSREKLHGMANLTSVSLEQQQTLQSSTLVNSKQQQDIANSMHNNLEQHQEIVNQALVGFEQPKTVFQTPVNFVLNSGQQHGMMNPTTVNFEQRQNVIGLTYFGMTSPAVQPSNIEPALSCSSGAQKLDANKVITASPLNQASEDYYDHRWVNPPQDDYHQAFEIPRMTCLDSSPPTRLIPSYFMYNS
ncbi:7990_t:CDS:2, partial [Racocetra persica]